MVIETEAERQLRLLEEATRRYGISRQRLAAFSSQARRELARLYASQRADELHEAVRVARVDPLRVYLPPDSPTLMRQMGTESALASLLL
jgi:predicted aminopeptidase